MKLLTVLALLAGMPAAALAATIYVPDDHATIQGAIDAAGNGDTIVVRPGTYSETIDFVGKAVALRSELGAACTTIDGMSAGAVVTFQNGEGPDSIIEGFTIKNGKGLWIGGGISCLYSSPTIRDNIIAGNTSGGMGGGGIGCWESCPAITSNAVVANVASSEGGAISCWYKSDAIITNNVISGNAAGSWGGGIACTDQLGGIIQGNSIRDNLAESQGGGISSVAAPALEILGNTIMGNAARKGGGVYGGALIAGNVICANTAESGGGIDVGGPTRVIGNSIIGNKAFDADESFGGGIYCQSSGYSTQIINNLVVNNQSSAANGVGGGIFCEAAACPQIINNTVAGNLASSTCGGVSCERDACPTISNSIVWGNAAPSDPEIGYERELPAITYSDVGGGWPGAGNIDADPLFAGQVAEDFHLTWTSPCRNAGDNSAVDGIEDCEGDPRVVQGQVDIGADEFYFHLYHVGDVIPGDAMDLRVVGGPGMPVLLGHSLAIQDPPQPTSWGDLFLTLPPAWSSRIGTIPANGVLTFPITVPSFWNPGDEKYFQALVGAPAGPHTTLTNLATLEVE